MTETKTHTIVPAQAGWFVRYFIKGTKEYEAYLSCEPIVAWEIERFDRPTFNSDEEAIAYFEENAE
ncbi:hypothetical protein [Sinorhizobium fredii]|uniref:hypothetical protein n=1 Tax=Rhizobium fredii TaxID=380 RepID=UPI0004B7D40E|nr:hypothetical protein [Sinorhizobium fredii]